jgi:Flp pilus assembly protein TadG
MSNRLWRHATGRRRQNAGRRQPASDHSSPVATSDSSRGHGQALVEFALVLPVMMLVLLVAIDFGRLFFSYVQITNAAREGAAYGISAPDDNAGINAVAQQETNVQSQSQGSAGTLTVTTTCAPEACATAKTSATRNVVTVTASQPFSFLTPVIGSVFGTMTLRSSASSVAIGQAGVPVTPPPCISVPNVTGLTAPGTAPGGANATIIAAGLVPSAMDDLTTGTKNVAKNQLPVAGTCVAPGSTLVSYHYRP